MTPQELIRQTAARFEAAGIPDPIIDAALLLSHLTGKPMLMLRLDRDTQLTDDLLSRYDALCTQRLQRVPLQYLTHDQPFCGRTFYVDERVLIPRPETELLAELAVSALKRSASPVPLALDLCCGSGCLGITLALEVPHAQVHACDLSEGALAVTHRNAEALGAQLITHHSDLFAAVPERFDLIVSNPPYIPAEECTVLQPEVLREPLMALDGGADGYDFYRRIAAESPAHLVSGGTLLLEVGDGQAPSVAQLLRDAGFIRTEIHLDLRGVERMVTATL